MNASSWAAVAPASRMWYPEIEIGCQRGMCRVHHSIMSIISRIDGSAGKIHSFWAMYSLRMSAWIVPPSRSGETPCRSATHTYWASTTAAGALTVIEVVTRSSGMPREQILHVGQRVHRHALAADLAQRAGVVGVVAHQGGHVEGRGEAGLAVVEQVAEALVGVLAPCRSRRTGASSTSLPRYIVS